MSLRTTSVTTRKYEAVSWTRDRKDSQSIWRDDEEGVEHVNSIKIMRIDHLYIKGFRNYKEATVNFNKSTLIIGANDVGKTNLVFALQILMDRSVSEYSFELKDLRGN